MPLGFISHSDCGRHDTGWHHPEHVGRLRAVTRALREEPELYGQLHHHEGRHATMDELALVHDRAYVERVCALAASGGGHLDRDTPVSDGSWDAATAAAGSLLDAVDFALDGTAARSFCAVRPPGHHALRADGMGFCVFGNVAVAAHYARSRHGLDRVLIVDWDVHHGNGTQALVQDDPGIRFVSMHQWPWYPGTGAADDRGPHDSVWNVPMAAGLAREAYVEAFEGAIVAATTGWDPQLVFVSAGFDSLAGDPLGAFTLTPDDFVRLTRTLVELAERTAGGRLVSALEGGYAPEAVGRAVVAHLKALA